MADVNEFESLKRLLMTWEDENLDLAIQLMKGNLELKEAMEAYLKPLFDVLPKNLSLLKDLKKVPQFIDYIQLDKFEPGDKMQGLLESMPIQRISFSYRKLSSFPLWICRLKNLRYLLLEDCGLEEIPIEIGNLENLLQLNLDKNKITKVPESIGQLKNLRKLQLDFNQIEDLPETVGDLNQLEWLCLESNRIKVLPKSCLNLSNLRWLSIEGTPLGKKYKVRSGIFIQTSSPRFAKFCDVL